MEKAEKGVNTMDMEKMVLFAKFPLGEAKQWELKLYQNKETGAFIPVIHRPDGKFFEIVWADKGFERPIAVNFGLSKVCVAIDPSGNVAVEPEKILLSAETGDDFGQNRIIRASSDNPKYQKVPEGVNTGKGYPDGQRVIYRDGPVEDLVTAVTEPPMREKSKGEFVPCQMIPMSELGETMDVPGKAAIFDAFATFLPDLLNAMGTMLYEELIPVSPTEK
jgi:hypothetical protein